jgi:hypothetical protein
VKSALERKVRVSSSNIKPCIERERFTRDEALEIAPRDGRSRIIGRFITVEPER